MTRALAVIVVIVNMSGEVAAGCWEELPPPGGKEPYTQDASTVGADGIPYAMAHDTIWWWNGKEWLPVVANCTITGSTIFETIAGGNDRPVYFTQDGTWGYIGGKTGGQLYKDGKVETLNPALYRLENGKATLCAELPAVDKNTGSTVYLYVSKAGDVFLNWGEIFARWDGKGWNRFDITERPWLDQALDFGPTGPVVFLSIKCLYMWDGKDLKTGIKIPEIVKQRWEHESNTHGCVWGGGRALLFNGHRLGCVDFSTRTPQEVDVSVIQRTVSNFSIENGWGTNDGAAWLMGFNYTERDKPYRTFVRISADGSVSLFKRNLAFGCDSINPGRDPRRVFMDSKGSTWFGGDGVVKRILPGGTLETHDWKKGMFGECDRFFETKDGKLYAATLFGRFYQWHEDKEAPVPDPAWKEYLCIAEPCAGPDGALWMVRKDRPGYISRWDGGWTYMKMPLELWGVSYADDKGHAVIGIRNEMALEVSTEGVILYQDVKDAIASRLKDGARRFTWATPRSWTSKPVVVSEDGRIWMVENFPKNGVLYYDGKWNEISTDSVAPDAEIQGVYYGNGVEPLFHVDQWLCKISNGTFQTLEKYEYQLPVYKVRLTRKYDCQQVPYFRALPTALRSEYVPWCPISEGNRLMPTSWETVDAIAAGEKVNIPTFSNEDKGFSLDPYWNCYYGDGFGYYLWIYPDHSYRWLDGIIVRLNYGDRPFKHGGALSCGTDPVGNFWCSLGEYDGACHLFIRERPAPEVQVRNCEVEDGRWIKVICEPCPKATAVFAKLSSENSWKRVDGSPECRLPVLKTGRRTEIVTVCSMDAQGVLGSRNILQVDVSVKLPDTRLSIENPPGEVEKEWKAPVEAVWTRPDIKGQLEWRVNSTSWKPLPADGILELGQFAGKEVTIEFRAMEEGVFTDPEPLTIVTKVVP